MKTKHLLLTAFVALCSYYAQADCRVDTNYSYNFIPGTSVKEKTGRTINTYDVNNNKTQEFYQTWDGGSNSWKNASKRDYTYDTQNNPTQQLYQVWDGGSNSWKSSSKRDYTYDAKNNQTQYLYQTWDGGSNAWENYSKSDYTYDAANNKTQELSQYWDGVSNSWKNNYKYDWTYDANGCKLSEDYYSSWNASGSYYDDHSRNEYFNTYLGNTGIATLNTSGISVYPNPVTSNKFTIHAIQSSKYSLYDIQGRSIQQGNLEIGENIINTPNLQAGIYFVNINGKSFKLTAE